MKLRGFGTTGWRLSALGFGGVPLSFGDRPNREDALVVIRRAVELGITLFDTANSYCHDDTEIGHNERLIRDALVDLAAPERERVKVLTKGGYERPGGGKLLNGRPEHMRSACEKSLVDLGVEAIDLYQHHTPDPKVPVEETVGEMSRLRDEGKVLHLGVSNYSLEQLERVLEVAPLQSVQNRYSITHREPERDGILSATATREMAFIPWAPLGGIGGGATSLGQEPGPLAGIAERRGVSAQQVALAWLLGRGDHVFPIPGSSRVLTLEDSARASQLELDHSEVASLDSEFG